MTRVLAVLRGLPARLRARAREVESWWEWIYPRRSLRFTREGWFFVLVTMAIGMAALNTGHNLFYLLFAMLVSLIVVSSLLSERAVRSLSVERRMPREIFARSAAAIELRIVNRASRRSSYAVEVRDGVEGQERRRVGFLDRLDPGAERSFVSLWTFPRRGRQGLRSVHLRTRFPFGLFEKTRIVPIGESCLVLPGVGPDGAEVGSRGIEGASLRKSRVGDEVVGLRRKLPDDDPRRIHWRVSARLGEWMVTEHAEALDRPLAVFFDSRGPEGEAFERAIERAARLVWSAHREGRAISFDSWHTSSSAGEPRGALAALEFLAEVRAKPTESLEAFTAWCERSAQSGGGVYVTAGDAPTLPAGTVLRVA